MAGGSASFTLDDGETLRVPDEDLRPIYDSLWDSSDHQGAISTAALVMDLLRLHPYARRPVELTTTQSAALRKAMARAHSGPVV